MAVLRLVASLAVVYAAAYLGAAATTSSLETWYRTLDKPAFSPPDWLFGPVWTILFTAMGVSLYLVWSQGLGDGRVRIAIAAFALQLVLNVLWSFLFFAQQSPPAAFIEIMILWAAILATIVLFWRVSVVTGALLIPYLLWVSFAGVLNFFIWRLNA